MDLGTFHEYCLAKPAAEETFPFDEHTLVFKVMGKMFALTGLERHPFEINLKCDPERSVELREEYAGMIYSGYHMSKLHWNTIVMESEVPDKLIFELIDHSYELVVKGLRKKDRELLEKMG